MPIPLLKPYLFPRVLCELVTYLCLSFFCVTVNADVIVVTRVDSEIDIVTRQWLSELWLKQSVYLGDTVVEVMDLPENNPTRQRFYSQVVGKTGNKLSAYWAKQVFIGNVFPPFTSDSETAVIQWLKESKNRLAYINDQLLEENLKVIYRIPDSQGSQNNEN